MMLKRMVRRNVLLLAAAVAFAAAEAVGAQPAFDWAPYDHLLHTYVNERGYADYPGLKLNRGELDAVIAQLDHASPDSDPALFPTRIAKLAYWINAYNAFVLRGVVDYYPIASVKDVYLFNGFFSRIEFKAGGTELSLRELENEILRKRFGDPRIHFAIVCASEGCPRLAREAYLPERLDEQLDARTSLFFNEDRNVRIDAAGNRLFLSKIMDWYSDDFIATLPAGEKEITSYVERWLTPDRQAALARLRAPKIAYVNYDWRINDQARPDVATPHATR
jgi:hypothetical protein